MIGGIEVGLLVVLVVGFLLLWFVLALFLFSAKVAGVGNRTYGKAFLALIIRAVLSSIIIFVFSIVPLIGTLIGMLVSFLLNAAVIAGIFSTSFGKGIVTEFLFIVFAFLLSVIGFILLGGTLFL